MAFRDPISSLPYQSITEGIGSGGAPLVTIASGEIDLLSTISGAVRADSGDDRAGLDYALNNTGPEPIEASVFAGDTAHVASVTVHPTNVQVDLDGAPVLAVDAAGATVTGALAATGPVTGPNLPASSTAKAGKHLHWGHATGTTDASGYATITHGAGFTPTVVTANNAVTTGTLAAIIAIDTLTSTTFRIRCFNAAGSALATAPVTIGYFCGE